MSLQSDLIQYLIGLGTAAASRVYDEQPPQGAPLPMIATKALSGSQPTTLGGQKLFARSTIRLGIFARGADERDTISKVIRDALQQFRIANPSGALIGATKVVSVSASKSADEIALSDGDNVVKGGALDLSFMYQE